MSIKVSLIAASIREELYNSLVTSLLQEDISLEVIFAGHKPPKREWSLMKYIETKIIKPAQAYDVCRREAKGEVVVWIADDAESYGQIFTKAYKYWKEQNNKKLVLSLQTKESDAFAGRMHLVPMTVHSFFGGRPETPLMAPLGLMSREYLNKLGGFHRDFVGNQAENEVVMRVYEDGGKCEIFGDRETYIELDHFNKHGGPRVLNTFYPEDRRVLERAWVRDGKVMKNRQTPFIPYSQENITIKSQGNLGGWKYD